MKKYLLAFLIIAVVGTSGFFAVRHINENKKDRADTASTSFSLQSAVEPDETAGDSLADIQPSNTTAARAGKEKSFDAEIISVNGNVFELESKTDGSGISLKSKVKVTVENKNVFDSNGKTVRDDDFENFRAAKVTFYGEVMETYPLMVNADKIVLSQREKCNVYFYLDGKIIKTLTVDPGTTVESADMPNAGAYCDEGYHFDYWMDEKGEVVESIIDIKDSVVLNAKISHD